MAFSMILDVFWPHLGEWPGQYKEGNIPRLFLMLVSDHVATI